MRKSGGLFLGSAIEVLLVNISGVWHVSIELSSKHVGYPQRLLFCVMIFIYLLLLFDKIGAENEFLYHSHGQTHTFLKSPCWKKNCTKMLLDIMSEY